MRENTLYNLIIVYINNCHKINNCLPHGSTLSKIGVEVGWGGEGWR